MRFPFRDQIEKLSSGEAVMKQLLFAMLGFASLLLTLSFGLAQEKKAAVAVEKKIAVEKKDAEKKDADEKADKLKADVNQLVDELVGNAVPVLVVGGDDLEADADPNVNAWQQQFTTQFRQLLKAELHFVRVVCQPTKPQYQPISVAGEKAMKRAVKEFAEVQKKMMRGVRAGEQPGYPDPRKLITDGLSQSIKATLSAEQAARYQEELDKRAVNRKQVALRNLVAKLDQDLILTAEQRGKLTESLSAGWKDAWGQSLEMLFYVENYFPSLPDSDVLPILNDTQKEVWRGTVKADNGFWGWNGLAFVQGAVMEEEAWLDEPPAETPQADQKPEQKDQTK